MSKQLVIDIPEWMDEEKLRNAILQAVFKATRELSIEEVRKMLGIKSEDLTDELDVEGVEKLRGKEKERLKWLY